MRTLNLFKVTVLAGVASILTACGGLPEKVDETSAWSNDKLYAEAQDALTNRDWTHCIRYFERLEGRDPFSRRAQQAQINIAYCNWKDKEPAAAKQALERFMRLHPNHPEMPYAYYLKGLISFKDDLGFLGRLGQQDMSERDPQALRDAYDAFKIVVERYPQSRYAPDAVQRMRYIVDSLAAYEVHTADYYYRRGAYLAAINRAQYTLKKYPNTPAMEDALHLMVISYQALGDAQLAKDAERVLRETFPKSKYLTESTKP